MSELDLDLGALEALVEAATPGPWKTWGMGVCWDKNGDSNVAFAVKVANTYKTSDNGSPRTFDADLICALRNAAPQLIAAARELERVLQQLAVIKASGHCGSDVMSLERIEAWATELGWDPKGAK